MTDYIGVSGSWKTKAAEWIGVGGSWKPIAAEWIGVGGAWKVMYSALSVSASDVYGSNSGFANSGLVNGTGANAVASGGSGSYTYQWTHVSTSSGNTPGIGSPTSVNPTWSATVQDGTDSVSIWQLVVTDTTYGVTASTTINVTLSWMNNS